MKKLSISLAIVLGVTTLTAIFPVAGRAEASSSSPTAAAAPIARADLFVIDQDHHTVVLFSPNGAKKTVVGDLTDPVRIAVDKLENVFVVDIGTHRLIKANPRTGQKTVLRSAIGDATSIALDYRNNLYVLDGPAVLKYAAPATTPTVIGSAPPGPVNAGTGNVPQLTSDWAGNVSISYPTQRREEDLVGVWVKTLWAGGGAPNYRRINVPSQENGYFDKVTEGWDGSLYEEVYSQSSKDGNTAIIRATPRSSQGVRINTDFTEYAYAPDHHGNFYLLQNRRFCSQFEGCVDDYAVDSILVYGSASTPTVRPISGLQLPVGGIAVDDSGTIYGAVLLSARAYRGDSRVHPEVVRIDPGATTPTVLAAGHFSMPTVANHVCWA